MRVRRVAAGLALMTHLLVEALMSSNAASAAPGPIKVASLGATPPTLANAPLAPGEQITVNGVTIRVDAAMGGGHRVTVTHG